MIYILLIVLLVLLVLLSVLFYYVVIAGFKAAPFVPTSGRDIDKVLAAAKLKRRMQFVDLGSGDGRLVIKAVKRYQVSGVGIEINPLLVLFARLYSRILGLKNAVFIKGELETFPLNKADVIYIFLLPKVMGKVAEKIKKECVKGTLIISRGFEVPGFKKIEEMESKTFWTYFYRV